MNARISKSASYPVQPEWPLFQFGRFHPPGLKTILPLPERLQQEENKFPLPDHPVKSRMGNAYLRIPACQPVNADR